jgi:hypothetical protein
MVISFSNIIDLISWDRRGLSRLINIPNNG